MTTEQTTPIGDRPMYPCHSGINWHGITYRQWLIGQALCGLCANNPREVPMEFETAIAAADAVLAQL